MRHLQRQDLPHLSSGKVGAVFLPTAKPPRPPLFRRYRSGKEEGLGGLRNPGASSRGHYKLAQISLQLTLARRKAEERAAPGNPGFGPGCSKSNLLGRLSFRWPAAKVNERKLRPVLPDRGLRPLGSIPRSLG